MKKLSKIFALALTATLLLTACKPPEIEHIHTFSDEWSYNEAGHWHAATCEHKSEKKDLKAHTLENGVCTVCGYRDPDYQEPPPDEPIPPDDDLDTLFSGEYTRVNEPEEISKIRTQVAKMLLKIGAGGGFAQGDIQISSTIGGAYGREVTLAEPGALKMALLGQGDAPSALYASENMAFEEYEGGNIFLGNIEGAAENFAENVFGELFSVFSPAMDAFHTSDATVSERRDGERYAIRLYFEKESVLEFGEGADFSSKLEYTFQFVLRGEEVLGLQCIVQRRKIAANGTPAEYSGGNSQMSVRVGNFPITLPDADICEPMSQIPAWAQKKSATPCEELFSSEMQKIEDEVQKRRLENLLSDVRTDLFSENTNYYLRSKNGDMDTEIVLALFDKAGARAKKSGNGSVFTTDEEKCIEDGEQGESRLPEVYDEFSMAFGKLLSPLEDFHAGKIEDEALSFFEDMNFYVLKISESAKNRDTVYVFSLHTRALVGISQILAGTQSMLLRGDYNT